MDVGGGSGEFLRPLLDRFENVSAVLFDLPLVVDHAKTLFADKYKSRVQFEAGSFFEKVPEGDCFNLRFILHDWNDQKAEIIAKKVAEAMRKSGKDSKLTIVEILLEDGDSMPFKFHVDMVMAILVNGKERTKAQFAALLDKAGLKIDRVIPTPSPFSIIEASLK